MPVAKEQVRLLLVTIYPVLLMSIPSFETVLRLTFRS